MRDPADRLSQAFAGLETIVAERANLPGPAKARVTARRRRARNTAMMAAGVVAVLLISAGLALDWVRRDRSPVIEPTTPPVTTPGPTPTTPVPTTATPTTPAPTTSITPTPTSVVDQKPPLALLNATLEVPDFETGYCTGGALTFQQGEWTGPDGDAVFMESAVVGDVNGDGAEDVVVVLRCEEPSIRADAGRQVLAYSGEQPTLLGRVFYEAHVIGIFQVLITPGGIIELDLFEVEPFLPSSRGWRDRYRWNGSTFELVDRIDLPREGAIEVEMAVDPTDIEVGPAPTAVAITIHNRGPSAGNPFRLLFHSAAPLTIRVHGATAPLNPEFEPTAPELGYDWRAVLLESPPAGQSTTVVVEVSLAAGESLPAGAALRAVVDPHEAIPSEARAEATVTLRMAV